MFSRIHCSLSIYQHLHAQKLKSNDRRKYWILNLSFLNKFWFLDFFCYFICKISFLKSQMLLTLAKSSRFGKKWMKLMKHSDPFHYFIHHRVPFSISFIAHTKIVFICRHFTQLSSAHEYDKMNWFLHA